MIELLKNFSISEIMIFIILLILAIKGGINTLDWFHQRGEKFFRKNYQKPKELDHDIQIIKQSISELTKHVNMLIDSDKDDIKAFITRQHHYFVYQKGWIDDYSLDCIQQRYNHYQHQGGNSFICTLMKELRGLPKQPISLEQKK